MRRRFPTLVVVGALASAGCSAVGYPAGVPPSPAEVPARGGEGSDRPAASDLPADLPAPEPRSRRGNPASYEVHGRTYRVLDSVDAGYVEEGFASWYGDEFAGRPTSSGEPFDPGLLTAAHRALPLPTWIEVENLRNGRRVVVRVNDRGPFADTRERILDLSEAAARELGMIADGVAPVRITVLAPPVGG